MPRSKTSRTRAAARATLSETRRRQTATRLTVQQSKPPSGLDRHRRVDLRPPKFPGRLGGR